MNLKKIEADNFFDFQSEIEKLRNDYDRTLNLTWFYVAARFKTNKKDFELHHCVDGKNDGGIDFYFNEGNTYYIIQSKYHSVTKNENIKDVQHEIQKIEKTLIGENTNKYATDFINALRRDLCKSDTYLEIVWLTTNNVS